ncbi:MAG: monovalent cation:proton antiporter-2 (CPA2) family protein [Gammaproteobacteria bacterium]|nr:monovalent cation:proton antiporter-2 (CPA2) family protein [Gammaproteobacteria bacterium]
MSLLAQIALFLASAVIAIPLFRRFRLGSVLGYLVAGMLIGPAGFGLIQGNAATLQFAGFGIVLLMFVIGLELQPSRLWVMRKPIFALGSTQVLVTTLLLGAAAHALGFDWRAAVVIGFGLSMSSTALSLQLLAERGELGTSYGRAAFGTLLFQDLAVMPALALLPLLASGSAAPHAKAGPWLVLRLVGVFAVVVVGGRHALRPMLRIVARTRVTEAFTAAGLLVVVGTALLVGEAGLSTSLGAFLAGVLLADSEFRHELEASIEPFKGLLLGLFFITVGMGMNLRLALERPLLLISATLGYLVLKMVAVWTAGALAGLPPAARRGLAFTIGAGGEFAFLLFALASTSGILTAETAQRLTLVVSLSMVASPLSMALRSRFLPPPRRDARPFDNLDAGHPRVIVAGFGRFGQIVGRILRARNVAFTALDANPTQVDFLRNFGAQVYYGDASRLELLRAAHAEEAEILVLAIDDVEVSMRTAELVVRHFPHLKIFARARNRQHAFRLMDLGVRFQIRETLLSSLEMAVQVLEGLGAGKAVATEAARKFRLHDEQTLLAQQAIRDDREKLIQSGREAAEQLRHLFETDIAAEETNAGPD